MENRATEIEKRIAYLEKYLDELNEVVIEQQRQLESCRKQIARLQTRNTFSPLDEDRPHDDKPPHY